MYISVDLWWIALIIALILGTVIAVYFYKRHKDEQKVMFYLIMEIASCIADERNDELLDI